MKAPNTLQDAIQLFSDYENCRQFMVAVRYSDGKVRCPYCDSEKVAYLEKARLYRCYGNHPKQKFSLKVRTVFEDSPIALEKWLPDVWLIVNCKNGISSYELHRALGVTQKSAWFMLHRIRLAMQSKSFSKLGGPGSEVEVDETYIGGKARNMHLNVKQRRITGRLQDDKSTVMGFLERGSMVRTEIVRDRQQSTLQPMVRKHVQAGVALHSDELGGYKGLQGEYKHKVIDHAVKYVDGRVHTNGL